MTDHYKRISSIAMAMLVTSAASGQAPKRTPEQKPTIKWAATTGPMGMSFSPPMVLRFYEADGLTFSIYLRGPRRDSVLIQDPDRPEHDDSVPFTREALDCVVEQYGERAALLRVYLVGPLSAATTGRLQR